MLLMFNKLTGYWWCYHRNLLVLPICLPVITHGKGKSYSYFKILTFPWLAP